MNQFFVGGGGLKRENKIKTIYGFDFLGFVTIIVKKMFVIFYNVKT